MRAGYVLGEVATGLRRNITMTVAMVLTTAISLGLLGFGLMIARLTDQAGQLYETKVQVSVNLTVDVSTADPSCTQTVCQNLSNSLQNNPDVASFTFESQQQAFERYQKEFAGQPAMLEIVRKQALSAAFHVKLKDPERFKVISAQYSGQPGVDSVDDQSEIVDRLFSFLNVIRNTALVIAGIQAVAAVLLISNMVLVAARSRRTETSIMRLVGATRWRTQLPFMIEAVTAGLVGVVLAIVGLIVAKATFVSKVFSSVVSSALLPPIDDTYVVAAAYWLIPIGVILSAAAAYVTLRLYVRL